MLDRIGDEFWDMEFRRWEKGIIVCCVACAYEFGRFGDGTVVSKKDAALCSQASSGGCCVRYW